MTTDNPELVLKRGAQYKVSLEAIPSHQMPNVLRYLAGLGIEHSVEMTEAPDPARMTVTPGDFIAASVGFATGRHSRMNVRAFNAAILYGPLLRPESLPEGYPLEVIEQADGERILEGDVAAAAEWCTLNGMTHEAAIFSTIVQHQAQSELAQ